MIKFFFQNNAKAMLALLFTAAMSFGFISCSDDTVDNPVENPNQDVLIPGETVEPTADQMEVTVTADMPMAVMGQFDDNSMGAALIRRMQAPTLSVNDDTKLALLNGSSIEQLSYDEMLSLAKVFVRGGYLAFEKPTYGDLLKFAAGMVIVAIKAEVDELTKSGHVIITPDSPEAARRVTSPLAEQFRSRVESLEARATRGIDDVKDALYQTVGEMVIIGRDSYYLCEKYEGLTGNFSLTDQDGNLLTTVEEPVTKEYSQYRSGLMADGAAHWLNTRIQSMEERQAQARRMAATRANGSNSINDMMSASDEFTFQGKLCGRDNHGEYMRKEKAHHETIRVWGSHNTETKKDYYYVQQKVRLEIGGNQDDEYWASDAETLYKGPLEAKMWWNGSYNYNGTNYSHFYGAWLQSFESTLNLKGSGDIKVEEAIPTTDNNNVSTSIAIGETHSETNTIGFTLGGAFGSNGGSFNPSFNYSHGWTDGSSYTMTTTENAKELKCKKNTSGSQVTWTYECGKNMEPYRDNNKKHLHQIAPDALVNDVDIDNQVCWSVSNPEGQYEIALKVKPMMRSVIKEDGKLHWCMMDGWTTTDKTFTLKTPNRAVQEWYMDITFPEIGQEGHHGDKGKLIEYLQRQFPDLYQPRQSLADQTDTSEGTIKYLVDYSKQLLLNSDGAQTMRDYALDLGLSQYTIKWYTIDGKHNRYELVIKAK